MSLYTLAILLAGGYMMFTMWGINTPWIVVSIGAMLLMAAHRTTDGAVYSGGKGVAQ